MTNFLSVKEIAELKLDHRVERESRFADRIKAVLMRNSGWSWPDIAEVLLLDEKTIRNYLERYHAGGLEGLCSDEHQGRPSILKLSDFDELEEELRSKIYPTTTSIICYVWKEFSVRYSNSGMTKVLQRMGFSYKKPQAIPGKANAKAQEDFLFKLEALKQSKSPEDAILYIDSTHPQHNSHPEYGWLPKGENTTLKTNTGRQRVTLNGALNAETHDIIVREDKILNAENTIKFFKQIESNYKSASAIYLILDNAGYFKGKKIKEYLETSKIQLLYLPPYAPNLNLIERVWKFFKKKVLANKYYDSFAEFRKACLRFFHKKVWRSFAPNLDSLLTNNFQIIGE